MNCLKCGNAMEAGTLQINISEGVGGPLMIGEGVRWFKEGEKLNFYGTGGEELPFMPFGLDESPGFICRRCGLIAFDISNRVGWEGQQP